MNLQKRSCFNPSLRQSRQLSSSSTRSIFTNLYRHYSCHLFGLAYTALTRGSSDKGFKFDHSFYATRFLFTRAEGPGFHEYRLAERRVNS